MNELSNVPQHTHNGTDTSRLDPKFFEHLPFFSIVPANNLAPSMFLYSDGVSTHRIYFRHDAAGVASLYYVALTKV